MNGKLFEALQPSWAKVLRWLSALTRIFALPAGGTKLERDQTNSAFELIFELICKMLLQDKNLCSRTIPAVPAGARSGPRGAGLAAPSGSGAEVEDRDCLSLGVDRPVAVLMSSQLWPSGDSQPALTIQR